MTFQAKRKLIIERIQQSFLTGQSNFINTPVEEVKAVMNKHSLVLYAPLYIKGEYNIPISYPFCNIEEGAMQQVILSERKANQKELQHLESKLLGDLDSEEREYINHIIYEYKVNKVSLLGKTFNLK